MKEFIYAFILILNDFLVNLLCLKLAIQIKNFLSKFKFSHIQPVTHNYFDNIWWIGIIFIIIFLIRNNYKKRLVFWDEWKEIIICAFIYFLIGNSIIYLKKMYQFPRSILIIQSILLIFILPIVKYLLKVFLNKISFFQKNIIIIGPKDKVNFLEQSLKKRKELGFKVIKKLNSEFLNFTKNIKNSKNIDAIIILNEAFKKLEQSNIRKIQIHIKELYIVPDIKGTGILNNEIFHLFDEQIFLLKIKNNLLSKQNKFLKRIFDLLLSLILLPVLLPVIGIIAILIKIDSKGPVFFVQDRLGENGKIFKCFKFRSMFINSDEILNKYLKMNKGAKEEWTKYKKLKKGDPRVTKVGRFLRKTSFDELPQIFNVLKGDMSLVGPRPYMPREYDEIKSHSELIHFIKPGITGLWQISGRNELEFKDRLKLDTWYVLNWSLWLDIVILIKTIKVVIRREGAY